MAQAGIARLGRFAEQFLSRGEHGDIARHGNRRCQQVCVIALAQYRFRKRRRRGRMDAAQRSEGTDQAASEAFRLLFCVGTKDVRQDRQLPRFFTRRMCAVSPHAIAIVCA